MRESKFRVWSNGSYKHSDDFAVTSNGVVIYHTGNGDYCENTEDQGSEEWFTGIRDKHNNPIYEGDIVRYRNYKTHGPKEDGVGLCFWDNASAGFLFGINSEWTAFELTSIEVIGNIHESPEKLEEE